MADAGGAVRRDVAFDLDGDDTERGEQPPGQHLHRQASVCTLGRLADGPLEVLQASANQIRRGPCRHDRVSKRLGAGMRTSEVGKRRRLLSATVRRRHH